MNPTQRNSPVNANRTLPFMTPINTTTSPIMKPIDFKNNNIDHHSIPTQDNGAFGEAESNYSSPTEGNEEGMMMQHFGATDLMLSTAEKAAALGKLALTSVASGFGDKKLKDLVKVNGGIDTTGQNGGSDKVEGEVQGQSAAALELGELEKSMRRDLAGISLEEESERTASNYVGEAVREAAREKNEDVRSILGNKENQNYTESLAEDDFKLGSMLRKGSTKPIDGYFGSGIDGAIEQTGGMFYFLLIFSMILNLIALFRF